MVDALRRLPEAQREVLALHYLADRRGQIAAELGIPEGTVKSRFIAAGKPWRRCSRSRESA